MMSPETVTYGSSDIPACSESLRLDDRDTESSKAEDDDNDVGDWGGFDTVSEADIDKLLDGVIYFSSNLVAATSFFRAGCLSAVTSWFHVSSAVSKRFSITHALYSTE